MFHFDFLWGRDVHSLEPVPGWALTPRRAGFAGFVLSAALRLALAGAEWLWVGAALFALVSACRPLPRLARAWLEREDVWPTLAWIVAGSLMLNAAGIWWGLPGGAWAPDELDPRTVLGAAAQHFSHGWFDRYPPFHFYVLTAAYSPLVMLQWLGRVQIASPGVATLLTLMGRCISLAAAAGTVAAVYACGARAFGRRSGLFAAAIFGLVAPFVYYAKTANLDVPYVFWSSLSLVWYLRALESTRLPDFVGFAVFAALAVVTKDQAYGLYLLVPFVFVHRLWEANRADGRAHPWVRAVLDRRLYTAGLTAVAIFAVAHNLAFNWNGFVDHVRYITGGGSQSYRMFERTGAGRMALLVFTADLIRVAWGWPLFLTSAAGVGVACWAPRHRRHALYLAVPAVSYYLGFTNVVLYNYDRFVLPICFVLAVFGGLALDRWLRPGGRAFIWRVVGVTVIFGYSLLYAASVDVAMLRDSRYRLDRWLAARVSPGQGVGFVFPLQYYPRLERFGGGEITTIDQLRAERPRYFVLNDDYGRAEPIDSPIGRLIAGLKTGALGYHLVFRYREAPPLGWLPGAHRDLVGQRDEELVSSSLRHINPTFEVYERTP